MADLRVRFIGDEGNRRQFFGALERDPNKVVDAVQKANAELLRSRYNIPKLPNREGYFVDVRAVRSEFDAVNNVVKQYGQLGYTLRNLLPDKEGIMRPHDVFFPVSDVQEFEGNVNRIVAASQKYNQAVAALERREQYNAIRAPQIDTAIQERTQALRSPRVADATAALDAARIQRESTINELLRQRVIATEQHGAVQQAALRKATQLEAELIGLEKQIDRLVRERNNSRRAESRLIANDIRLNELKAVSEGLVAQRARLAGRVAAAEAARNAAISAPVTSLPANYTALQRTAPRLLPILERAGLQPQPGQSLPDYLQRQTFNAPRYDLVRDVTRWSGEFQRMDGIMADWSAEVDRSGKVVTRFGGQLSGASQVLKQLGHDFQKVIEFTVATTVVFGALRYATEQLRSLSELDFALQKFAITAQQSPAEAQESFGRLAEIAQSTATPLLEIISAADDIALATQRAGQSTEQWQHQIFSLTESVGVFTNLTGIDTVEATDLLTASMKQLKFNAEDIPAILSKITAVAGGQSQAIADITKGLSVMAEAGRIAGLEIDEMIATVQVLSQVTSKTPAEVATAFKNLVGSLGSPGSLKVLEEFNILVNEPETGELRNILEIYNDINDAVRAGIIPASELQRVIRGISGGPRRAPDAAALLGALGQIDAATEKSKSATNEAAIANAKAIDTTQAKLIQLQSTIDAVTFKKFGGEFKEFVGTLTTFLTGILKAFNAIPTGVVTASIQIGLFFLAVRGGTRLLSFLSRFLTETSTNFLRLAQSTQAATIATAEYVNTARLAQGTSPAGGIGGVGGFRKSLSGNYGRLGAGVAIGAGLSFASGGNGAQIAGAGLQGLGIALLSFPEPTMLTKIAGGIALIGGTLLQFADNSKEAADEGEKAAKILDSFAQFKTASSDIGNLTDSQAALADEIERLNNTENKGPEQIAQLSNAQREYADSVLSTIDATRQADEARKELINTLRLSDDSNEVALANELELATIYGVTGEALDALILKYQKIILQRANPDLVFPNFQSLPTPTRVERPPETGSTQATTTTTGLGGYGRGVGPVTRTVSFDLTALEADASRVKDLFNETGTAITAQFEVTGQNIAIISGAIEALKASNDPLAASIAQTFTAFLSQKDAIQQAANNLATYQAYIDALTYISPEKAAELQKIKDFVDFVNIAVPVPEQRSEKDLLAERKGLTEPPPDLRLESQYLLLKSLKDMEVDYGALKIISEEVYESLDQNVKDHLTLLEFQSSLFTRLGIDLGLLGLEGVNTFDQISEAAIEAGEGLSDFADSATTSISDRLVQLKADFQAGIIDEDVYAQASAELQKYLGVVQKVTSRFKDSIETIPGFAEALKSVQPAFAGIIGLENAASLETDDFIERLLQLADTYGVNGKELIQLQVKLLNFRNALEELSRLKVEIPISAKMDIKSIKESIQALRAILLAATAIASVFGGTVSPEIQAQINALEALKSVLKSLDSSYSGGSGQPYGTPPSTKSDSTTKKSKDVSELDIPEEILQSAQMQELIQQAIKNAKELQKQIPGAKKEAKDDIVVLLDGLTKVQKVEGVKSEYLRKALEELAEIERKRLEFETKADTIRRIRVGAGDFSAIANVPVNSTTGVSLGGAEGPINITLNLNGTVLTPAQLAQFADLVAAALKRQIAGG